jgi:hypothetical protein
VLKKRKLEAESIILLFRILNVKGRCLRFLLKACLDLVEGNELFLISPFSAPLVRSLDSKN